MIQIPSQLVKELREKTGAGMMDCKKALEAVKGEFEEAVTWLRKKGLSQAAKKSGRVASEGLVGISVEGLRGGLIEVNSETDFVARNDQFQDFVRTLVSLSSGVASAPLSIEDLKKVNYPGSERTVEDELTHLISTIGENMSIRRLGHVEVKEGLVVSYIHTQVAPQLGRIGVLVGLSSSAPKEILEELGLNLSMQIAATRPEVIHGEELSEEVLAHEREIFRAQTAASGKPEDVIDKMVEGRLKKFKEEVVLMDQTYVLDGKTKIRSVIEETSKKSGHPIILTSFLRYNLGEGIEKETTDFAAEVAEQLSK